MKMSFTSHNPKDENNLKEETQYACQACFLSDLVDANQIVFCEGCDIGVHQKCYGITDLNSSFYCQKCTDAASDLEKAAGRLSI
jgi:hypothetical protein